jgi:hypothetical protein
MHLEATSVRNSSSAGRAWSAQSPEVVGGWMMLSQVEFSPSERGKMNLPTNSA